MTDHTDQSNESIFMRIEMNARSAFRGKLPNRIDEIKLSVSDLIIGSSDQHEALNALYNQAHKLSGSGATFGMPEISRISSEIESLSLTLLNNGTDFHQNDYNALQNLLKQLEAHADASESVDTSSLLRLETAASLRKNNNSTSSRKIIVVDDDTEFLEALSSHLKLFNFELVTLTDHKQLTKTLETVIPAAIVMDIIFPDDKNAGINTIQHLKTTGQINCPVVFLSSNNDFSTRLKAISLGSDGYFHKPVNTLELVELLERLSTDNIHQSYSVLIVDDDEDVANYNATILQNSGLEVNVITDPLLIMEPLINNTPDVILMDINMPGCNGIDLSKVIRQDKNLINIPIVFLTNSRLEQTWLDAMEAGGDEFLRKSIEPEELVVQTISRAKRSRALQQANRKLIDSENRFRSIAETAHEGIVSCDMDMRIVYWNKGAENILGYSENEILGISILKLIPPDQHEQTSNIVRKYNFQSEEASDSMDTIRLHKNGSEIPVEITFSKWSDQNKSYSTAIIRDVSKRKKIEQSLAASEARHRSILAHATSGMITIDETGIIESINAAVSKMFGYDEEELIGNNISMLMPKSYQVDHDSHVQAAAKTGKGNILDTSREVVALHKDGNEFYMHLGVSSLAIDGKRVFNGVITDISKRVKAEKSLQKAHDTLENRVTERTQELQIAMNEVVKATQVKSEFMANMSHELRTPLNAILGFSDMIKNQYLGPIENSKYVDYATDISNSGTYLLSLINQILDIERIESNKVDLHKEHLDINEILYECCLFIQQKSDEKKISIVQNIPETLPPLFADKNALKQIIINLVANAVKFTPEKGKITLSAFHKNEYFLLSVKDTGCGIPDDKISRITDPFTRHEPDPHKTQEGVGLGLAIANSLVNFHNGRLVIKSKVGKGTKITISLPTSS